MTEHTDAPMSFPRDGRLAEPDMTDEQVRIWINACNHEPARRVLRVYLMMKQVGFEVGYVARLRQENARLKASEQAWKIIAKQNDKWNALPQSEKEAALQKALDSATEDLVRAEDEIEWLQQYMTKEQIDASRSNIARAMTPHNHPTSEGEPK